MMYYISCVQKEDIFILHDATCSEWVDDHEMGWWLPRFCDGRHYVDVINFLYVGHLWSGVCLMFERYLACIYGD